MLFLANASPKLPPKRPEYPNIPQQLHPNLPKICQKPPQNFPKTSPKPSKNLTTIHLRSRGVVGKFKKTIKEPWTKLSKFSECLRCPWILPKKYLSSPVVFLSKTFAHDSYWTLPGYKQFQTIRKTLQTLKALKQLTNQLNNFKHTQRNLQNQTKT